MRIASAISMYWLTGPILSKELRQTSRRPWMMIVKTIYVALLAVFIAIACYRFDEYDYGYASQQMGHYGQSLTLVMVWFQFIALQLIAMAAMSTSISDEVRRRTLFTLLSTPITPLQIVMGKLLSRLLAIAMLIGISLPVLAIMRVFGGVPWDFLVQGLCVTATAVLYIAVVSLFFSIICKRAYSVILLTLGTLGVFYIGIPLLLAWLHHETELYNVIPKDTFLQGLLCINPYATMYWSTERMMYSYYGGRMTAPWVWHCLTMLCLSILTLLICVCMLRRKNTRLGEGGEPGRSKLEVVSYAARAAPRQAEILGRLADNALTGQPDEVHLRPITHLPLKAVKGNPITWKEIASPLFPNAKARWFIISVIVLILLVIYGIAIKENALRHEEFNIVIECIYLFLGLLTLGSVAAGSISGEREGSTLELLLATEIRPWTIAWGKFVGSFRRSLIVWPMPMVHLPIMMLTGRFEGSSLFLVPIVFFGLIFLVGGLGTYFSAACKKTATAVMFTIGTMIFLWLFLPFFTEFARMPNHMLIDSNPAFQIGQIIEMDQYQYRSWYFEGLYHWQMGRMNATESFFYVLMFATVNFCVGMWFVLMAAWRLGLRRI